VIGNYTLAHGSPREPVWEYILEPLIATLNFPHYETPYCLVGHTHQPIIYELVNEDGDTAAIPPTYRKIRQLNGHRQIINPGSVGQPRDQNPDAAYAILDVETNTWEHRRIPYDIAAVQKRMRTFGMPERLINRLEHGW
jgi:diadenosine tetraphosphatase ApaH/serine/threonine PP2A family protein phosphatase